MNGEGQAKRQMPRYKSHKIVHALKIAAVETREDGSAIIAPGDEGFAPFEAAAPWATRFHGSDDDLGYYVVYKDGYTSWSPTEAFKDGHTRCDIHNEECDRVSPPASRLRTCRETMEQIACHTRGIPDEAGEHLGVAMNWLDSAIGKIESKSASESCP